MTREVRSSFNKILDSETFKGAAVLIDLLRFLFEESIVNERTNLTAYVIATEGLKQPSTFDAQKNPLVRVQAGHLRKLLEAYYLKEGVSDPWRIIMPKGGYHLKVFKGSPTVDSSSHRATTGKDLAPRLAVLPFDNLSGDDSKRYICDGITQEIIHLMTTSREIQLLSSGTTFHYRVGQEQFAKVISDLGADYLLHGSIRINDEQIRVTVFLFDAHTEQHVWTEQYQHNLSPQSLFQTQEEIAEMIAHHVTTPYGAINRHLRTKNIDDFSAYASVLRYYEYQEALSPETHQIALNAIERTIVNHPEYAEAWGCVAGLYAAEYMFGFNVRHNDRPPPERALEASRKTLQLLPDSVIGLYGLANSYYYLGDREAFRIATTRYKAGT
jgi:adenylate cyclase